MKIITSGCSFTHAPDSWANYLKDQYELINVAEGGGGNEMNIRNLSRAIIEYKPDYAILQISGIDRYELISDELIDFESDAVIKNENYTWLKSTGDIEWAKDVDPRISKPITNYMKYCYNKTHQILRTLHGIVNFQTLCEKQNVKYKMFFWMRELNTERKKRIFENEELKFWYDKINWGDFWLYDTDGGLCEWGIDNGHTGALHEDHLNNPPQGWAMIDGKKTMIGHPSTECHQAFAEKVVGRWITDATY
jgi:hypothetical protein